MMPRIKKLSIVAVITSVLASAPFVLPLSGPARAQDNRPGETGVVQPEPKSDGNFTVRYQNKKPFVEVQFQLDQNSQTRQILTKYNETEDEKERSRLVDELTKVISDQFDARQEQRENELKQLEEQVRKLRALHQRRAKEKEQIIRDRVRQLLRDADGLGWGSDAYQQDELRVPQPVPVILPARR